MIKRALQSDKILQLWRNVLFGATNETKKDAAAVWRNVRALWSGQML